MTPTPPGWSVGTTGSWVYLVSADGNDPPLEFELSDADALAIGVALIRSSERARAVRAVTDLAEESVESEDLHSGGADHQGECASAEGGGCEDLTVEIRLSVEQTSALWRSLATAYWLADDQIKEMLWQASLGDDD
jgi:hypothetical protein